MRRFAPNAREVLFLGLPLAGSHLAQFALHVTDTIMLGWYGVTDLAAGALGATVFFTLFTLGSGFAQAVMPMVATAEAAGQDTEVRRITRMGMWLSIAYGLACIPLMALSEPILLLLGQDPDIAYLASGYLAILGLGMVPALLVMTLKSYLAALGRTQVVLWATVAAVGVNVLFNWLFIYGNLGFPEMGVRGAAWASVIVQIFTFAAMLTYVLWLPQTRRHTLLTRFWRPDWVALQQVNRLGLPIGGAMLAETGLFAASAIMMGWLGAEYLAAHSIALEITALFFMIHMGLSNAGTVLVGRARGHDDIHALRAGARSAITISMSFALLTIGVYFLFGTWMAGLFLSPGDPAREVIIPLAYTLLLVAALFQFADAGQVLAMGLLRGLQDTRVPMVIATFSYWVIGVPASYVLAFPLGWEGVGLWFGLVIGLMVAAVALMTRFWAKVGLR
jgi:MATE family multidrug resistance protein